MAYQPVSISSRSDRPFTDHREAGKELAAKLAAYRGRPDDVVLALPRGGVPVAFEVAEALDAPLDIFLVRKLGMPGHPEFAIGAIASGGVRIGRLSLVVRYAAVRGNQCIARRTRERRRNAVRQTLRERFVNRLASDADEWQYSDRHHGWLAETRLAATGAALSRT